MLVTKTKSQSALEKSLMFTKVSSVTPFIQNDLAK